MNFDKAVSIVLVHEGSYVNDKDDAGGETNFGISKRAYPKLDIKNLTRDRAIKIYHDDYWLKSMIDDYPPMIRLQMFDMSVNMGQKGAVKVLQRALVRYGYDDILVDGIAGKKTFAAANMARLSGSFVHLMTYERILYYHSIVISKPSQLKYLKGWTKRTLDILEKSM